MMPNPAQNIPMPAPGGGVAGAGGGVAGYPFPMNPQFYQSPYGAAYANQMQQWYYNYYQRLARGWRGGMVVNQTFMTFLCGGVSQGFAES